MPYEGEERGHPLVIKVVAGAVGAAAGLAGRECRVPGRSRNEIGSPGKLRTGAMLTVTETAIGCLSSACHVITARPE
jgi:hypothetical protein